MPGFRSSKLPTIPAIVMVPRVSDMHRRLLPAGLSGANKNYCGPRAFGLRNGFAAAIDWWDDVAPELANRDHRVIRIDLIGHGGTAAPNSGYAIERRAALVAAILDKLGVDRSTVIGHSLGGEVATALAEFQPPRIERLIFVDSPAIPARQRCQ
jgi:pimeloyl-ACP methyl ester carboxylesterase